MFNIHLIYLSEMKFDFKIIQFLLIFVFLNVSLQLKAQEKHKKTNAIDFVNVEGSKQIYKSHKKLIEVFKQDTKGLMYGNICVVEVTHKMGFEYVVEHDGSGALGNFFHNRVSYLRIMFRNGLFWRHKLKLRIEDCKQASGDFIG